ncbi:MAG: ATP-binding cassette domain-containing protein [Actinomycetota bacterium]|nr:ATP-binding cassette domain-containing protein [Actinomycetota bacterium]
MPPPSGATLNAIGIARSHGAFVVLDQVSVLVGPRSRIGVVGPNGVGKTTLLRILAGIEPPDAGRITLAPPSLTVGYLPQETLARPGETLVAYLARRTGVAAAEADMESAAAALGEGGPGAEDRYSAALERYLALGGPDQEARAAEVCQNLGLPADRLDVELGDLSGGQVARAALAAILLSRFDVLLLDEPTNDLDFAGLDQLERFLTDLDGALVVVSHDRAFLEATVDRVLELDEHSRSSTEYGGGWLGYLEAKGTARRHAEEAHSQYTNQRDQLVDRARTQRQWAVTGARTAKKGPPDNDKALKGWKVNRTEKQASKVRITEKALERLEVAEKPWEGWDLHLDLAPTSRSGDSVAGLGDAVVDRGSFRLGPLSLEITWAERVAVVGPNGSGKTTLLRALLGQIPLTSGQRWLGPGVVVGELDQGRRTFLGGEPLIDAFARASGWLVEPSRSLLAKFGLGAGHVGRSAAGLSPGERTRATLGLLMATGANCLVLDEPTNHLDLPAIEQLEQALDDYAGTLLLVTHDRRLLDALRITRTISL